MAENNYKLIDLKQFWNSKTSHITLKDITNSKEIIISNSNGKDSTCVSYRITKRNNHNVVVKTLYTRHYSYGGSGKLKEYPKRNVIEYVFPLTKTLLTQILNEANKVIDRYGMQTALETYMSVYLIANKKNTIKKTITKRTYGR